jgi:hypothetical protein
MQPIRTKRQNSSEQGKVSLEQMNCGCIKNKKPFHYPEPNLNLTLYAKSQDEADRAAERLRKRPF